MKQLIEIAKKYHIIVLLIVSIIVAFAIDILKPSNIPIVEEYIEYIWKNANAAIFRYIDMDETEKNRHLVFKEVQLKNTDDFEKFMNLMKPIADAGGTCGCGGNLFRIKVGTNDFFISWPHFENIEVLINENSYGMMLSEKSLKSIEQILISNGVPKNVFERRVTTQNLTDPSR